MSATPSSSISTKTLGRTTSSTPASSTSPAPSSTPGPEGLGGRRAGFPVSSNTPRTAGFTGGLMNSSSLLRSSISTPQRTPSSPTQRSNPNLPRADPSITTCFDRSKDEELWELWAGK